MEYQLKLYEMKVDLEPTLQIAKEEIVKELTSKINNIIETKYKSEDVFYTKDIIDELKGKVTIDKSNVHSYSNVIINYIIIKNNDVHWINHTCASNTRFKRL